MFKTLAKLFGCSKPEVKEEVKVEAPVAEVPPAGPAKIKATRKPRQKKPAVK